jgi:ABC-type sugar transport system ATPase subunit
LKKDSGDFYLHGQKININSPSDARRHKFALIVDDYANMGLINTANILNNISLANYYRACTNKTRFIINNSTFAEQ